MAPNAGVMLVRAGVISSGTECEGHVAASEKFVGKLTESEVVLRVLFQFK